MKRSFIVLIFSFLLLSFLAWAYWYATSSQWKVSAKDAREAIQQGKVDLILDVRTALERKTLGFYPGSIHIASADLQKIMPVRYPNRDINILIYCNTGQRARRAADILHSMGYKNVRYIAGSHLTLF